MAPLLAIFVDYPKEVVSLMHKKINDYRELQIFGLGTQR